MYFANLYRKINAEQNAFRIVSIFSIFISLLVVSTSAGQAAASSGPSLPPFMKDCETVQQTTRCVTWSFSGPNGTISNQSALIGELYQKWTGMNSFNVDRVDVAGGSSGLTAVYTGTQNGTGFSGTVIWKWPGVFPVGGVQGTWTGTPAAAPSSAAAASGLPTVQQFVRQLFAKYQFPDFTGIWNPTGPDATSIFAPSLLALIRQDQANGAAGKGVILDYDPICNCQDYDTLTLSSVTGLNTPLASTVQANFLLDGVSQTTTLKLVEAGNRWKVQDIQTTQTPSLFTLLQSGLNQKAVAGFINLTASAAQQAQCGSDSVAALTMRVVQPFVVSNGAGMGSAVEEPLGLSETWRLLGRPNIIYLPPSPDRQIQLKSTGAGTLDKIGSVGPLILDAGKDSDFQGSWMMCKVTIVFGLTYQRAGEAKRADQSDESFIILIPSDREASLQTISLFGVLQAQNNLSLQALATDPDLDHPVQQGIRAETGQ